MPAAALVYALLVLAALGVFAGMLYDSWQRRRRGPVADMVSPEGQAWIRALARSLAEARDTREEASGDAFELWGRDLELARRRLALACDRIERVALPELAPTLATLRRLSRTVEVLPPPRPLAEAALHLWRTRGPASVGRLLLWLGTTGMPRVRVRLWFARRALLTAVRAVMGTPVLASKNSFGRPWYPTLDAALEGLPVGRGDRVVTAERVLEAFTRWQESRATAG